MTKKQKKTLKRIITAAVLYLAMILASKLVAIPLSLRHICARGESLHEGDRHPV